MPEASCWAEWGAAIVQAVIKVRVPTSRPTVLNTQKQMDYWLRPCCQADLDKLAGSIFDVMTGVVLKDDAQIVRLLTEKVYANQGERPGVDVTIEAL